MYIFLCFVLAVIEPLKNLYKPKPEPKSKFIIFNNLNRNRNLKLGIDLWF